MTTLDEAWKWYLGVRESLKRLDRLAARYWDELPRDGRLSRDDTFRELDHTVVTDDTQLGLRDLDDLAVFVLFSVFEAEVRSLVLKETRREREAVTHQSLKYWMSKAEESIQEGSFHELLQGFKAPHLHDLIERVNQVRRYRNWVAHGRRIKKPDVVTPSVAYERLTEFLQAVRVA